MADEYAHGDRCTESERLLGPRRRSRTLRVGNLFMGGGRAPLVQSMNNTDTRDVKATLRQIAELAEAGCALTRVAVPDMEAADALKAICAASPLPVIADIHFDYRLALAAVQNGAAKIRINPGNIGGPDRLREVAAACKERDVPIRVGVNAGSLAKEMRIRYGGVTVEALCQSALESLHLLERVDFKNIVVSLKSSNPALTIACYRSLAGLCDYPLHLGVTEAGTEHTGALRSAVGIGALLAEGIGDTIRVSLTADPIREVEAAYAILNALHLARRGITLVSCPTCGRTEVDLLRLAAEVESRLAGVSAPLTVAVMGCVVNGPGEAREADIGIAGGRGKFILFAKGEVIGQIPEEGALEAFMAAIRERFGLDI